MNCIKLNSLFSLALIGLVACEGGMSDYGNDSADTGEWEDNIPTANEDTDPSSHLIEIGLASAFGERAVSRSQSLPYDLFISENYRWKKAENIIILGKYGIKAETKSHLWEVTVRVVSDRDLNGNDGLVPSFSPATVFDECFTMSTRNSVLNGDWSGNGRYVKNRRIDANGNVTLPLATVEEVHDEYGPITRLSTGVELERGEAFSFEIACRVKSSAPATTALHGVITESAYQVTVLDDDKLLPIHPTEMSFPENGINVEWVNGSVFGIQSWVRLQ